jgi:hypothetical protein
MTNQEIHDALWQGSDVYGLPDLRKMLTHMGVENIEETIEAYYEWCDENAPQY